MSELSTGQARENGGIWPRWRAVLARIQTLVGGRVREVLGHAETPALSHAEAHVPTPCSEVLMVVLNHELWKHPRRHPGDEVLRAAEGNQDSLCDLLAKTGWPSWRIRRICSLRWSKIELGHRELDEICLTPMSWVFQLGAGSNRARDVARGAATALAAGRPVNEHVASIRAAREQPRRRRALVMRETGNTFIVEDGNHFVVAMLLSDPECTDGMANVPAYLGTRTKRRGRSI